MMLASAVNFVHIHLAINHSPLYATIFALCFVAVGMAMRNRGLVTAGLVITVIAALCAIAADATGNEAADIITHSPPIAGVDTKMVDPHDDAATWALTASCVTGGLALIAFFFRRRWLEIVILFALVFSLLTVGRTALLGGRIHHPEVRAVVPG